MTPHSNHVLISRTKGDAELKIDSKHFEYRTEEAADSLTLVLHKATPEDSGKYSCIITNEAGSATTSSKVTVQCKIFTLA